MTGGWGGEGGTPAAEGTFKELSKESLSRLRISFVEDDIKNDIKIIVEFVTPSHYFCRRRLCFLYRLLQKDFQRDFQRTFKRTSKRTFK